MELARDECATPRGMVFVASALLVLAAMAWAVRGRARRRVEIVIES